MDHGETWYDGVDRIHLAQDGLLWEQFRKRLRNLGPDERREIPRLAERLSALQEESCFLEVDSDHNGIAICISKRNKALSKQTRGCGGKLPGTPNLGTRWR